MPRANLLYKISEAIQIHIKAICTKVFDGTNFVYNVSRRHYHFIFSMIHTHGEKIKPLQVQEVMLSKEKSARHH